jgi:hypothetical protein
MAIRSQKLSTVAFCQNGRRQSPSPMPNSGCRITSAEPYWKIAIRLAPA